VEEYQKDTMKKKKASGAKSRQITCRREMGRKTLEVRSKLDHSSKSWTM